MTWVRGHHGPALVEETPEWMRFGTCRVERIPTAVFYPSTGDDTYLPISICERCPVRKACLELALDTNEDQGIWGGKSERERRRLRAQRKRQRERASA